MYRNSGMKYSTYKGLSKGVFIRLSGQTPAVPPIVTVSYAGIPLTHVPEGDLDRAESSGRVEYTFNDI